jgi:DNA-binding PadR family transcriptional regulator
VLELAILGLLKEQELHGYELKKRLAETAGPGNGVSFGSLYPALGRLVASGALRIVDAAVEGPDPGATTGGGTTGETAAYRTRKPELRSSRGKKVYAITDRGEALFDQMLAADAGSGEDDRSFNLRLAFARHLPPDARIGMLERRRAYLMERLARTKSAVRHRWGRLDAYTRSLMEHGNETTERDISWLDRLIAWERAQANGPMDLAPVPVGVPAEVAAVAAAAWAVSTAPTMPAPPARVITTPPTPARSAQALSAPTPAAPPARLVNSPAPPAMADPQAQVLTMPAPPAQPQKLPAPPAHERGGDIP